MTPKLITLKDMGFEIVLAKAKVADPKLRYRRKVEQYSSQGGISRIGRNNLGLLQTQLGLSPEVAEEIEAEVLRPYKERLENLKRYRQAFLDAVEHNYPLSSHEQSELEDFRELLGLRQEDVDSIQQEIFTQTAQQTKAEQEAYQQKLERYEQEFRRAIASEYPLSEHAQNGLRDFQRSLGLKGEDIEQIEHPIRDQNEAEYQQKKREADQQRQREEQERLRREQELSSSSNSTTPEPVVQPSPSKKKHTVFGAASFLLIVLAGVIFANMGGLYVYECVCASSQGCDLNPENPDQDLLYETGEVYRTRVYSNVDDFEAGGFSCTKRFLF
ncbi:MAG: hypothetical protein HC899_29920 [Leptolyngbyaceae cyanobacterium SM1_4_3]|nr:hypothetical protein [Leptolyngbyaceae cyanobacterium SM1_4_3]